MWCLVADQTQITKLLPLTHMYTQTQHTHTHIHTYTWSCVCTCTCASSHAISKRDLRAGRGGGNREGGATGDCRPSSTSSARVPLAVHRFWGIGADRLRHLLIRVLEGLAEAVAGKFQTAARGREAVGVCDDGAGARGGGDEGAGGGRTEAVASTLSRHTSSSRISCNT